MNTEYKCVTTVDGIHDYIGGSHIVAFDFETAPDDPYREEGKAADSLEGTSMVSNNDIREMVPFNLLRNSRADDGLAYWVSSGFEADSENGASGTASFKAEGVAGMTKSLSQTVYPANRSSYTLSAQIGSENLEKLSDDAQVGIEVVIEYEDGSTESRFIDLY